MIRKNRHPRGFSILELLIVVAVITVLGALTINTAAYMNWKAARERATAEVRAIETALESYKVDNGDYPRDPATTDLLNPLDHYNPNNPAHRAASIASGKTLYAALCPSEGKVYFTPQKSMINPAGYLVDPFGNPYGYSTDEKKSPSGFIALWSTCGRSVQPDPENWEASDWVRNW